MIAAPTDNLKIGLNEEHAAVNNGPAFWRQQLNAAYRHDAQCALAQVSSSAIDAQFIERILELLRTYVEIPGVAEEPQPADGAMLQLAQMAAGHIAHMGYWRQMNYLWPKLCTLAEFTGDADLYINFAKYHAIVKGRQTDGQAGFALYTQLIRHPAFQHAAAALQADILAHYATNLLWTGQRIAAAPLLQRCLSLTDSYAEAPAVPEPVSPYDRQVNRIAAPLWETRAYTLNQQGVLHMFCGEFGHAQRRFDEMLVIFLARNEGNNLACVAYQAIGRLCLYAGDYRAALTTLDQGLQIRQARNDREGIAINAIYVAAAYLGLAQLVEVERLLNSAMTICRELDNTHDLALCHLYLGELAFQQGQSAQARSHWQAVTTIAPHVVLHFVELRPWLRYLPPLLWRGELTLCWRLLATLWRSTRHDQLTINALWRFLWV